MTPSLLYSVHPLVKSSIALDQLTINMMQMSSIKRRAAFIEYAASATGRYQPTTKFTAPDFQVHSGGPAMETAFPDFNSEKWKHIIILSKPKRGTRFASSWVQIYAKINKQKTTQNKTEISLPGQKPSLTLFQRPSTVAGTPWRGPAPAGARAVQW